MTLKFSFKDGDLPMEVRGARGVLFSDNREEISLRQEAGELILSGKRAVVR